MGASTKLQGPEDCNKVRYNEVKKGHVLFNLQLQGSDWLQNEDRREQQTPQQDEHQCTQHAQDIPAGLWTQRGL